MLKKILNSLEWLIPSEVKNLNFSFIGKDDNYYLPRYKGEDTWVAAVSYIPFVSAAVLLLRKNNSDFIFDHARQALILTILALLVLMILPSIWRVLFEILLVSLIVISIVKAISGNKFYIPIISELSRLIEI